MVRIACVEVRRRVISIEHADLRCRRRR
jgi:hypothetical protein